MSEAAKFDTACPTEVCSAEVCSAEVCSGEIAPAEIAIQAIRINRYYGHKPILYALNLNVQAGEFVAVIGRSGCGKSTLLRILQGLDQASEGSVFVDGQLQTGLCASARTVFQDGRLLPWRSIGANVWLGNPQAKWEQVLTSLDEVGLGDRAMDWPHQLSGGQRQRVALARALIACPKHLFLDEPLASLDALTRFEMQLLIQRLWQSTQITTVLVTHDVDEAVFLADRIVLMESGYITKRWLCTLPRPRDRYALELIELAHAIRSHLMPGIEPEQDLAQRSQITVV